MKKIFSLATFLFAICFSSSVRAQLTMDFTSWAGDIMNWVTKISENATEVVKPVAEQYETIKKAVAGAKESLSVVKEAKEKFEAGKKKIEEAKAKYDELKGKYDEVKGKYDEVKGKYDEVKGKYDDAKGKLEDTAQKAEQAKEQAEAKAQYAGAKEKLEELKQERQKYIDDETAKYKASIQALEYNNKVYSQKIAEDEADGIVGESAYRKNLKENEAAIEEMQEKMKEVPESDTVKTYDEQIAAQEEVLEQRQKDIEAITAKAAAIGTTIGTMAISALGGLFSGKNGQEYAKAMEKNFVPEGEAVGGDIMSKIAQSRREGAYEDTIAAYKMALEIKQQLQDNNDMLDDLYEQSAGVESGTGAILTETTGIKVKTMKNMLDFVKLQIAEMKMETALDMLDAPYEARVKDVFNYDDYVFTQEDATGEARKSWKDKAKDVKKFGTDAVQKGKETAQKAKEDVGKAKEEVENAKEQIDEFKGNDEDEQ